MHQAWLFAFSDGLLYGLLMEPRFGFGRFLLVPHQLQVLLGLQGQEHLE